MVDRAREEQAALGYFCSWIKAMAEGDHWVRFHSRILDGDRGGIHSVRIQVDGVLLAVIPDPASQAMHKAMDERAEMAAIAERSEGSNEGETT